MRKLVPLFCFLLIGLLSACHKDKPTTDKAESSETVVMPDFNADSAFFFVKTQTDFGPRVPNDAAHVACGDYLINKLKEYCDTTFVQSFVARTYDGNKLNSRNLIGSFSPEKEKRVLLGAHWDSRPFADQDPDPIHHKTPIDGANDGASGVGVLLEIARQLQLKNPEIGVDIIFFDAEDYGTPSGSNIHGDWWCLGSQYWANNPHIENYTATFGVLLDMVGSSQAKFYHEGFSSQYAQNYLSKIWGIGYSLGYKEYFINNSSNPITDDHYYVNKIAHIPMVNIVHQDNSTGTGFTATWHTLNDNLANIDKTTLRVVGTTLLTVIYNE